MRFRQRNPIATHQGRSNRQNQRVALVRLWACLARRQSVHAADVA
jgi:hypothetical protein